MKVKEWKCKPCQERSRLRRLAVLSSLVSGKEEPSMKAGKYKILRGEKTRLDKDGIVRTYRVGDVMDLDEREAQVMKYSVEPVQESTLRVGPASEQDEDKLTPIRKDFLDAPAAAIARRVSYLDNDGALEKLAEAEAQGKSRKTVFRAIEERRSELSGASADTDREGEDGAA